VISGPHPQINITQMRETSLGKSPTRGGEIESVVLLDYKCGRVIVISRRETIVKRY